MNKSALICFIFLAFLLFPACQTTTGIESDPGTKTPIQAPTTTLQIYEVGNSTDFPSSFKLSPGQSLELGTVIGNEVQESATWGDPNSPSTRPIRKTMTFEGTGLGEEEKVTACKGSDNCDTVTINHVANSTSLVSVKLIEWTSEKVSRTEGLFTFAYEVESPEPFQKDSIPVSTSVENITPLGLSSWKTTFEQVGPKVTITVTVDNSEGGQSGYFFACVDALFFETFAKFIERGVGCNPKPIYLEHTEVTIF